MPLVASFATPLCPSLHLLVISSGSTALATRGGDGNCLQEPFTYPSVFTEKCELSVPLRLLEWFAIHMVRELD